MKTLTLLIFTFLLPSFVFAQFECDFIKLCSQQEIDNFPKKFGHCNKIFSIEVDDNCNKVTNLDSLYAVVELGELRIQRIDTLQSIHGLRNLRKVGRLDFIQIKYYPPFPKLDTVTYLVHRFVGKDLNLSLYSNIKHIDTSISLNYNGQFNGLPEFTSSGKFRIGVNGCTQPNNLKNVVPKGTKTLEFLNFFSATSSNISLEGLEQFDTILGAHLNGCKSCDLSYINNTKHLQNLYIANMDLNIAKLKFENIKEVEEISLNNLNNLIHLEQLFPNLEEIRSKVTIKGVKDLENISLLDDFELPFDKITKYHIVGTNITNRIVIKDNPFLVDCASPYICKALQVYPDSVIISGNGVNCSKEELLPQCINSTGEEYSNGEFKFYPNPAVDIVSWSSTKPIDKIEVVNVSGQVVYKVKPIDSNMDVTNLPSGVYMFHVYGKGFYNVQKMVKI